MSDFSGNADADTEVDGVGMDGTSHNCKKRPHRFNKILTITCKWDTSCRCKNWVFCCCPADKAAVGRRLPPAIVRRLVRPEDALPRGLFAPAPQECAKPKALMVALDGINGKFGRGAGCGLEDAPGRQVSLLRDGMDSIPIVRA